jgi:hypothetical protein
MYIIPDPHFTSLQGKVTGILPLRNKFRGFVKKYEFSGNRSG